MRRRDGLFFRLRTIVELRDIKTGAALDYTVLELIIRNVNDSPPQIQTSILESAKHQNNNGKYFSRFWLIFSVF